MHHDIAQRTVEHTTDEGRTLSWVEQDVWVYPESVSNTNIPRDVLLLVDVGLADGSHDAYYISPAGSLLVVNDGVGAKPRPAYPFQMCRLTGYTYNQIGAMYQDWINRQEVNASCASF